ncbi:hypothetical protein IWQ60_006516 [Tieghemiomyces parasiticus]|uniref:Uncharacterized protein n=1 Tax=Tieghemiomyces parasiticus TaxID=78921 RepID=A0A9W8A4U3_9FUNG|nr:hypothetical protein IWQ60_006516 [Tieghemiomyces parasiticus]
MTEKTPKRRPGGLKRAHAERQDEVDVEVSAPHAKSSRTKDVAENEDEMSVPLPDSGETDELADLKELYDKAFATLETDSEKAFSLFRGLVHESDRVLRLQAEAGETPPPHLYWVYGMALFCMSELKEEADSFDFLRLASERFARGQELAQDFHDEALDARLKLSDLHERLALGHAKALIGQARVLAHRAAEHPDIAAETLSDRESLVKDAVENFELAVQSAQAAGYSQSVAEPLLIQEISLLQSYVDALAEWDEIERWNGVAIDKLTAALKNHEASPKLWFHLGYCHWSLAKYFLDQDEEDGEEDEEDDDEKSTRYGELIGQAQPYLRKSHGYLAKSQELYGKDNPESVFMLLTLGEVLINLGNCVEAATAVDDDAEESEPSVLDGLTQDQYYERAVAAFNQARQLGGDDYMLPEQFEQFLQDWEEEMQQSEEETD